MHYPFPLGTNIVVDEMHYFSLQLLYDLCLDPLTTGPMMDLLGSKKYQFFVKVRSSCEKLNKNIEIYL